MTAAQEWADALASWAIPDEILAQATESPWLLPTQVFTVDPDEAPRVTPSVLRAREALPAGGSVLDVGCGGGSAAYALVGGAAAVTGVDGSADMLAAFALMAGHAGVAHEEVLGRWPDVAADAAVADVVVCHHVLFNVADLPPFLTALTEHAARRVVVEITDRHPLSLLSPLWERFWGLRRPTEPTADTAIAVLRELGIEPGVERFRAPARASGDRTTEAGLARIRLCLPPEREPEVAVALQELGEITERDLVTLWWDVPA